MWYLVSRDPLSSSGGSHHKMNVRHQLVVKHDCVSVRKETKQHSSHLNSEECKYLSWENLRTQSGLPFSDTWIQALPVTSLDSVVVAEVLLLVLLYSRASGGACDNGRFFGRKKLSGHFTNTCQFLRRISWQRIWQPVVSWKNDTTQTGQIARTFPNLFFLSAMMFLMLSSSLLYVRWIRIGSWFAFTPGLSAAKLS